MFDILNFTTAASLANLGTLTVGYPAGRTKGDYDTWNAKTHVLELNGNQYTSPNNFTLTFNANASSITLTNVNMGTVPANTSAILQIDRPSPDQNTPGSADLLPALGDKMYKAVPYLIDLGSPNALNTAGICASQSVTSAVAALLNGTGTDVTANTDGSVTLNTPRNVTAAWTGTAVLTVAGFDVFGNAMTEASGSGTSFTGKKAFKKIASVIPSASITSATVGYGDVIGLPVAITNSSQVLQEIRNSVRIGSSPQTRRVYFFINQVDLLAGSANAIQIHCPISGVVTKVGTVVQKAITTGGTITFQDGATAFVGATITIANSAAQGASQIVTPTAGDASLVVAKNDVLQVIPASFATAGEVDGFIEISPTDGILTDGTLALALTTASTTTSADVRGTYKPSLATDGSTSYHLLIALPDYNNIGVSQK